MDIVIIPFHDCKKWLNEGFRTRDAHLTEHFARDKRVDKILVINRPVSLAEMVAKRHGWKTNTDLICSSRKHYQIGQIKDKIYCLDIFLPDFLKVAKERKSWWFFAFENKKTIEYINSAIKYLKMQDVVLLLQNPMATNVVQYIDYKIFAFDAIDNWLYHPQMTMKKDLIEKNYEFIKNSADIIFTVSESLKEFFCGRENVYWEPNGVDKEFFAKAIKVAVNSNRVVVGYVGKIQDRVDFDLVEQCLQIYSYVNFKFIGPIYAQNERIKKLAKTYKNIIFVGDVNYNNLPCELSDVDIAIIPHKIDSFTNSMNPLKLYEYLASGKIVITTEVAGTKGISKYVKIARNSDEFIQYLGEEINKNIKMEVDPYKIMDSLPEKFSWDYRCREILKLLTSIIEKQYS